MSYNDPKTTRPVTRTGGGRTIWMVIAAVVVVLLAAWFLGLFGRDAASTTDAPAITSEGTATTTEPVAPAPAPSQ
jgi:choline-glycine betaine transporter